MIQMASNPNDIIFDPFMGVGSTGVAALEMGRKFIGVELEKNYYQAARIRIDNMNTQEKSSAGVLREPAIAYGIERTLFDIDDIFGEANPIPQTISTLPGDSLQPIIKWAGGKEKELKYIIPNAPEYNNYYEPFVGGGSVYAALRAEHYYINDLSSELISLYQNIADQNMVFFNLPMPLTNLGRMLIPFSFSMAVRLENNILLIERIRYPKRILNPMCTSSVREIKKG